MRPRFGEGDCRICGHPPGSPFRSRNQCGEIVEGCIDDIHTGHVYGESARWHNRPSAKKHRAAVKARLKALTTSCRVSRR